MTLDYRGLSAITWTPVAVAIIIVSLRTCVRIRWRTLNAEDLLMLAALCFFVLGASLNQGATWILFSETGTSDEYRKYYMETSLSSVFLTLSLSTAKFSVAMLLLRLIASTARWKRASLIAASLFLALITILIVLATIVPDCRASEEWRTTQTCFAGDILPNALIQLFNYYSVLYDILCSYLPISIIHRLQISRGRKIFISIALSLGWTAAIFAILRAVTVYAWTDEPDQKLVIRYIAWVIEPALVMTSGSLASLGPLFDYLWGSGRSSAPLRQLELEQNASRGGSSWPLQLRKAIHPESSEQRPLTQSLSVETMSDANTGLLSGSSYD